MAQKIEIVPIEAGMPQRTLQILAKWAGFDAGPLAELIYRKNLNDLDRIILVAELTDMGYRSAQNSDGYIKAVR